VGLCPLQLILDRVRRFLFISEGVELLTQILTLSLGLFPSAPLLSRFYSGPRNASMKSRMLPTCAWATS
jgi:hypothetical protein